MNTWEWSTADDIVEVHELLCTSDAFHSTPGIVPPLRNIETTKLHVLRRNVHGLRYKGELVGMFTLTLTPPSDFVLDDFPYSAHPAYLQRLAVRPEWIPRNALIGLQCVRKAFEVAEKKGAEVVRAEINPDFKHVQLLLAILKFQQFGPIYIRNGRRCLGLQRNLRLI